MFIAIQTVRATIELAMIKKRGINFKILRKKYFPNDSGSTKHLWIIVLRIDIVYN
jgi:hypothetical protein